MEMAQARVTIPLSRGAGQFKDRTPWLFEVFIYRRRILLKKIYMIIIDEYFYMKNYMIIIGEYFMWRVCDYYGGIFLCVLCT